MDFGHGFKIRYRSLAQLCGFPNVVVSCIFVVSTSNRKKNRTVFFIVKKTWFGKPGHAHHVKKKTVHTHTPKIAIQPLRGDRGLNAIDHRTRKQYFLVNLASD